MNAKEYTEKVTAKVNAALAASTNVTEGMTESELTTYTLRLTQKAKSDVNTEEKAAALATLIKIVKTVASDDATAMAAVERLTTVHRNRTPSSTTPKSSRYAILDEMFIAIGDKSHEDSLFAKYKLGRKEIYWIIVDAIKYAKDEARALRKWVSFDADTGYYTYEAQGEIPPTGWKGYVPVDAQTVEEEVSEGNEELDPLA